MQESPEEIEAFNRKQALEFAEKRAKLATTIAANASASRDSHIQTHGCGYYGCHSARHLQEEEDYRKRDARELASILIKRKYQWIQAEIAAAEVASERSLMFYGEGSQEHLAAVGRQEKILAYAAKCAAELIAGVYIQSEQKMLVVQANL